MKLHRNWQVKSLLSFILLICLTTVASAQVTDENKQSTKIPVVETEKEVDIEKDQDLNATKKEEELALPVKKYTDSFDLTTKKSKGFTMIQDNDLVDPGIIYKDKWAKKNPVVEAGMDYLTDQYFGEFKTSSKYVIIFYRDFGEEDGDIIRVFANEDVIMPRVALTNSFKKIKLKLQESFNMIDFVAVNQGYIGPNTAQFLILDDKENIIYSNAWNLKTGGKASIVLVKE